MNDDLTRAITTALLASSLNAVVGGRIFPASQVPPDADFPRCYIAYRRPPPYYRYPRADGGVDRHVMVEILFAARLKETPQLAHMIEVWDKQARPIIEAVSMPTLAYLLRVNDVPSIPQSDDRATYAVGGGAYDGLIQEG